MNRKLAKITIIFTALTISFQSAYGAAFQLAEDGNYVRMTPERTPTFRSRINRGCSGAIDSMNRQTYLPYVFVEANAVDISPALLDALILCESAYIPDARSHKDAYGLTQLLRSTAIELGVDRNSPIENIKGGALYLSNLLTSSPP